jgi:hypothetical protein
MEALFLMLVVHALCDYPLQGDFIGKFKSWRVASPIPEVIWPHLLTAHALIHAGGVWLVTGSVGLAVVELVLHWLIDYAKCSGWTNLHHDQLLHAGCKVGYAIFLAL